MEVEDGTVADWRDSMTDKQPVKAKAYSRYAQKRNQPITWSHERHRPPVAGCDKCKA